MADTHSNPRRLRVAFVVQRYGLEVNGGAEALCRLVAERMTRHWEVDVLTTCALDYLSWRDHYPAGAQTLNGVTVRRFPVAEPRDIARFDRLSQQIVADPQPSRERMEEWSRAQGPWSPALVDFIAASRERYDVFFFCGYLYAQTYFGLPRVVDKAVFAPFAHDEWPIKLPMWDALFASVPRFLFATPEERLFLRQRFPGAELAGDVVAMGIDRPPDIDPARFRREHGLHDGFLLYVGRIDPSKGCQELLDDFLAHVAATGDQRPLVLLGRAVMPLPEHPQVRALGFVSETTKWDALAACDLLVMPSPYESLSIVLLEAWAVGKPVMVTSRCEVLRGQVARSNGGLEYRNGAEFSACVHALSHGGAASVLGRQGYDFVRRGYTWEKVEQAYLAVAARIVPAEEPEAAVTV